MCVAFVFCVHLSIKGVILLLIKYEKTLFVPNGNIFMPQSVRVNRYTLVNVIFLEKTYKPLSDLLNFLHNK